MGIIDTILRSRDDLQKPKQKSYWDYDLAIELIDATDIQNKVDLLPSEKRAMSHELSGKEPVKEVIIIKNSKKGLGRFTTNQIKDMLDDLGFNVDVMLSSSFNSDFAAVMNIGGYIIPGWKIFANFMKIISPASEKLFFSKLAPGKERLHIRLYEMNDGSWLATAHTDWNWMSVRFFKVFNAHAKAGAGNYQRGTSIFYALLALFRENMAKNQFLSYKQIEKCILSIDYVAKD